MKKQTKMIIDVTVALINSKWVNRCQTFYSSFNLCSYYEFILFTFVCRVYCFKKTDSFMRMELAAKKNTYGQANSKSIKIDLL